VLYTFKLQDLVLILLHLVGVTIISSVGIFVMTRTPTIGPLCHCRFAV